MRSASHSAAARPCCLAIRPSAVPPPSRPGYDAARHYCALTMSSSGRSAAKRSANIGPELFDAANDLLMAAAFASWEAASSRLVCAGSKKEAAESCRR